MEESSARARKALARVDFDIDVSQPATSYSIAVQQITAIARALDVSSQTSILDSPPPAWMKRKSANSSRFSDDFVPRVRHCSGHSFFRSGLCHRRPHHGVPRWSVCGEDERQNFPSRIHQQNDWPRIDQRRSRTAERRAAKRRKETSRAQTIWPHRLRHPHGHENLQRGNPRPGRPSWIRSHRNGQTDFGIDKADSGSSTSRASVHFTSPRQTIEPGFAFTPENRKSKESSLIFQFAKISSSPCRRARA